MTARLAGGLLIAAGLGYNLWIAAFVLDPELSATRSYVSELAADDAPHALLFRTVDLMVGVAAVAAALLIGRSGWRSLPRSGRYTVFALALFGIGTIADVFLPLECGATRHPVCAAAEATGEVSVTHTLHLVSSTVANAAALAFLLCLAVALRPVHPRWIPQSALLTAAISIAATAWIVVTVGLDESRSRVPLGVVQRAELLAVGYALALVGALLRHRWRCDRR
ncbi:DUF998 domain-containing protein [Nocardia otitidiscaviarum]|uniref:DUF998 domain-containing protein n=1 Tax=Nocardia otitidiscaviarum TaxID=1823 RepID=UPI0006946E2D|nr:DUF998 domain-containing protein [Nocardia otitidiscaviarum]MBF6136688.1 DUF998 domain-containing protein [Nocardia otitidiscaviarum]MBF6484891.1 DUF998 domain-containing protein [Nocardia otitidiscaviarum]